MRRFDEHPLVLTVVAFLVAAGTVAAVAVGYGLGGFWRAWAVLHPLWLVPALTAGPLAHIVYTLAYRAVAEADGAPEVPMPLVLRLVAAGFGPFTLGGGFAMDRHALHALHEDRDGATQRMLGLGTLEWLLLAPIVMAAAVAILVAGDHRPQGSMVWPWAVGVPAGALLLGPLLLPAARRRLARGGPVRQRVAGWLSSADIMVCLGRDWPSGLSAFAGMALYWALDIVAFYSLVRFIGLHPTVAETIVAYGTGFALTKRSSPLGGAGVTEALMTFSLHWMGQPVLPSLAAVVLYRVLSFVLPAAPALLARSRISPLVQAGHEGRRLTAREWRRARAPLRPIRR